MVSCTGMWVLGGGVVRVTALRLVPYSVQCLSYCTDSSNKNSSSSSGDDTPRAPPRLWADIDSIIGFGIDGVSSAIQSTSHTISDTVRKGEGFASSTITGSANTFKRYAPRLVEEDTKLIPDVMERAIRSTAQTSQLGTKRVRDGIGAVTGLGAVLGASVAQLLPQGRSAQDNSQSMRAIRNFAQVSAGALHEMMDTVDTSSRRFSDSSVAAAEGLGTHLFGKQAGETISTSLKAGKDLVDTFSSTQSLTISKLGRKMSENTRKAIIKEARNRLKPEEVPGAAPSGVLQSTGANIPDDIPLRPMDPHTKKE